MKNNSIFNELVKTRRGIAVLIDPDKQSRELELISLIEKINGLNPNFIFIGGSTVEAHAFKNCMRIVKLHTHIPVVIFPGSSVQWDGQADALLFLSLLSGRNSDYLIGHHVLAAEGLNQSGLEVIPTAYLLLDGGKKSAVEYVTQTTPIPQDQPGIIKSTALAGKLLGLKCLFLDAGSGAIIPVSANNIEAVCELNMPIIVGGGIRRIEDVKKAHDAGASLVVIGNKIEEDIDFILDLVAYQTKVQASKT